MEALAIPLVFFLSPVLFALPPRLKFRAALTLSLALAATTGGWALFALFSGAEINRDLMAGLAGRRLPLGADGLSAWFLIAVNGVTLASLVYGRGYLKPYETKKKPAELSLHWLALLWLQASMVIVVTARQGWIFLTAWELMALSSFAVMLFDHEKPEVVPAGLNYLVQMQVGFACLLAGFLYAHAETNAPFGFEAVAAYFKASPNLPLFLLLFLGFGLKAGFIPLHSWLPHAHPAAPSHGSALMSGVMIKMGIYGLLRVITCLSRDQFPIGFFLCLISGLTALVGLLYALSERDLKKILAYSSVENIGIIGLGMGLGTLGVALGLPALSSLGFAGALLHVWNHGLYKPLLFFCAGSVYRATHTRDLERLGGLLKRMPVTGAFFILGACAICGLPPLNGFISEFLILLGAFKALKPAELHASLLLVAAAAALALTGGLAIFCFARAFSITFLGSARSPAAAAAAEPGTSLWRPEAALGLGIIVLGLFPSLAMAPLGPALSVLAPDLNPLHSTLPTLWRVSLVFGIFIAATAGLLLLRNRQQRSVPVNAGPTWGCGFTGADPSVHQYTATSFSQALQEMSGPLARPRPEFKPFAPDEIFPGARRFDVATADLPEKVVVRPAEKIYGFLQRAGVFQTGKVQHYMLYALFFLAAVFVLTYMKIL